ncbi:snaclec bothrojaracin subunit beta-like [Brevipalpus obovatus]|uniref:snaclec bothrojaracin subunit beta-like n=1 Tax=Brevipalpus obovatus TaxID=246614 RepID=UPI003D9EE251
MILDKVSSLCLQQISVFLFAIILLVTSSTCVQSADCPPGWTVLSSNSRGKCIRFFDHKVNYTQAEFICRDIAEGELIEVESREEQKALIAHLAGLIPMSRSPVTWIGVKLMPPNKIIYNSGEPAKYTNFGGEEIYVDEEKCVNIFSMLEKNGKSENGIWKLDICSYADSGFVCQKRMSDLNRFRIANDEPRIDDEGGVTTKFLMDQFKDQLNMIKDICDSHMKAIERLSNNQLYMLQHYEKSRNRN